MWCMHFICHLFICHLSKKAGAGGGAREGGVGRRQCSSISVDAMDANNAEDRGGSVPKARMRAGSACQMIRSSTQTIIHLSCFSHLFRFRTSSLITHASSHLSRLAQPASPARPSPSSPASHISIYLPAHPALYIYLLPLRALTQCKPPPLPSPTCMPLSHPSPTSVSKPIIRYVHVLRSNYVIRTT